MRRRVAEIRAVDSEDDGITAALVPLPEVAEGGLAADVSDLEVRVREVGGSYGSCELIAGRMSMLW